MELVLTRRCKGGNNPLIRFLTLSYAKLTSHFHPCTRRARAHCPPGEVSNFKCKLVCRRNSVHRYWTKARRASKSGRNGSIWCGNYEAFFELISQRERRGFPLGLELKTFPLDLKFREKTEFLLRLVQDPARSKWPALTSSYEGSNSGHAIKQKNKNKQQQQQQNDKKIPKRSGKHYRWVLFIHFIGGTLDLTLITVFYFSHRTKSLMWKWNDQHVTSVGQRKKIWVPDRIRTFDLPNTGRALYPLHLLKSEAIHYVHIWHASCTTARISNVDVALCGERMKGGKFSARWNKCENEMISKSRAWDMNMNLVYGLAVYEFSGVWEVIGSNPVWDSDVFFVPRSWHADHFFFTFVAFIKVSYFQRSPVTWH